MKNLSKTSFMNLLFPKAVFQVAICTFLINTPTLYKNIQSKTHKNECRGSKNGSPNALLCFGVLRLVYLLMCFFEFEVAIYELPDVVLFPEMYI